VTLPPCEVKPPTTGRSVRKKVELSTSSPVSVWKVALRYAPVLSTLMCTTCVPKPWIMSPAEFWKVM